MISRFNFYDIYGYLIPGLALVSLLWIPFGLSAGNWPPAGLGSALLAVVLAYVAGHLLQIVSRRAFSMTTSDIDGNSRYPSDRILDEDDATMTAEVKKLLFAKIERKFQIKVADQDNLTDPRLRIRRRQDAFLLCRDALLKNKSLAYGEQFEGMYSMMRGLTAAFLLGAAYLAGWAVKSGASQIHPALATVQQVLFALGLGAVVVFGFIQFIRWRGLQPRQYEAAREKQNLLDRKSQAAPAGEEFSSTDAARLQELRTLDDDLKRIDRFWFWVILAATASSGGLAWHGLAEAGGLQTNLLLIVLGLLLVFVAHFCHQAFLSFADHFAASIYRAYVASDEQKPSPKDACDCGQVAKSEGKPSDNAESPADSIGDAVDDASPKDEDAGSE